MHRIVANCFKAIAYAIIFIIVWDVGFYLWRANIINQRMESLAVSMQEVVSKNNYLPQADYNMFESILTKTMNDMNTGDEFIRGFSINFVHNSDYNGQILVDGKNIARYRLDTPANYGDVQVIELKVGINASIWERSNVNGAGENWNRSNTGLTFTYTYLVPCLKYTTVTD